MAPIRRYLRITQYSVLEVRIYLDNPALAHSWLLNSRDPVLPRVIESVRPLVLPKLREENERARGKGKGKGKGKKKGVKDVVTTGTNALVGSHKGQLGPRSSRMFALTCSISDEYEVSIFLTESSTRHSLLTKHKDFGTTSSRLKSNSSKLTNWLTRGSNEKPVEVPDDDEQPQLLREEDDSIDLAEIPDAGLGQAGPEGEGQSRKPSRTEDDDEDTLFVNEESESERDTVPESVAARTSKRSRKDAGHEDAQGKMDDKKKLRFNTSYDGFSIYGRILCLVVKRRGGKAKSGTGAPDTGQQMLENWVSTQAAQDQEVDDDEEG